MILVDTAPIEAVINDRDDYHRERTHLAAKHLMSGSGTGGSTASSAPALDTRERGKISPVPDDDVEARVTSLEQEVARLREQIALTGSDATAARVDAAAARLLAAGADRDISEVRTELRAHTQTLNALREIQLEQGQQMRESFASQERRIGELKREMQGGFATMATGTAQITALLTEIRGSERDG